MEPLTPTEWISRCAHQLGERWRTATPTDLEEAAIAVWQSAALRALPPEDAAREWLRPISEVDRQPRPAANREQR